VVDSQLQEYLANNPDATNAEIAKKFDVTEVTIRLHKAGLRKRGDLGYSRHNIGKYYSPSGTFLGKEDIHNFAELTSRILKLATKAEFLEGENTQLKDQLEIEKGKNARLEKRIYDLEHPPLKLEFH
jgi:predicted ArsR family transcriptional regulator